MKTGEMAILEKTGYSALVAVEPAESPTSQEARLLTLLREGNRAAFEQVVAEYHSMVYGLALRVLGDAEEAQDVTQETFLKVFRHLSSFRGESGLKTWIYRIALNQAANQQRWWRRRMRGWTLSLDSKLRDDDDSPVLADVLADSQQDPEQRAINQQRDGHLLAALDKLKHDYRVAVVLRDIEGFSYEEIAETLAISLGTVKSRIARGREELRQRLKNVL